jgi:exodeoxyribonuclease VIII
MCIKDSIIKYKKGMKITKPCIVRGMPNDVYHKMPALSNSGLKMLLDCPAKYYYKYLSGEYEPKETPSFKIGKACHCYILEGADEFAKVYWHNPYSELKKDELASLLIKKFNYDETIKKYLVSDLMQLLLDNEGISPKSIHLNKNELNQVIGVAKAIKSNKHANAAFSQKGESELSIFWEDKETGLWLKCRPDFLPYDCKFVPDYKTCASVNPETFYRDFLNYGYHVQASMYKTGIKEVTGIDVDSFFFVAQEKEPPYITQVYVPDMGLIEHGNKAVRNALKVYLECQETGVWGAYSDRVIEMTLQDRPDEITNYFDKDLGLIYAPRYLDNILMKYEVA